MKVPTTRKIAPHKRFLIKEELLSFTIHSAFSTRNRTSWLLVLFKMNCFCGKPFAVRINSH